jgi:hypothetical protein
MDVAERIFDMKLKGYCCSQMIMAMGLEDLGRDNEDLIAAMGAFCNGMEEGRVCGTLAAGVSLLFLVDAESAKAELREALMDWFFDRFGGYDCEDIMDGNPMNRISVCPGMIVETYEKLLELLGEKPGPHE